MGCKKICKIFASNLRFKSGVMRGFQKCITLGGRASGSAHKVMGGVGGVGGVAFSIIVSSQVQSWSLEFGFWTLDFRF